MAAGLPRERQSPAGAPAISCPAGNVKQKSSPCPAAASAKLVPLGGGGGGGPLLDVSVSTPYTASLGQCSAASLCSIDTC